MKSRFLLVLALVMGAAVLAQDVAAQRTVIATIPVGDRPLDVAATPMRAFVTNEADDTLSIIDATTNAVVGVPLMVGDMPRGVAVDPVNLAVYVANYGDDSVWAVYVGEVFSTWDVIPVGGGPEGVAVMASTNRIYVTGVAANRVSVIDGATNVVTANIPVGNAPSGIAVNQTTNRIYAANRLGNSVSVIDGATNNVVTTVAVGNEPRDVAVNATTNRVYVSNGMDNTVSVIDGATNAVVATIGVGQGPTGVAANPTTDLVYVANTDDGSVSVISEATNAVVDTVAVGGGPLGVAVNPVANRIYVTNNSDDTVTVIEDPPEVLPPPLPAPPGPVGETEDVPLQGGVCNPVATTYPDNTPTGTIAGAVTPAGMVESLWQFEGGVWTGWSAEFPAASDLTHIDFLDVVFVCVEGAATFTRPVP
jgi:YVTN family beta-propeller protein